MIQTPFHSFVKARELESCGDLLAVYASSNIEVFPYQIAAAQFALSSPYLRGVVLCDEGSLGKTCEAMLIAMQKWYEGAKVGIIVTIPLYMQWKRLIEDRFTVPPQELNLIEKAEPVQAEAIAGTTYTATVTEEKTFTYEQATEIMDICEEKGYTKKGKIQDKMREAIKDRTLDLGRYSNAIQRFEQIVKPADSKPPITNAERNVTVRLKKNYDLSREFTALWNKISQKTTYRVKIDTEELVSRAVKSLKKMDELPEIRLVSKTADFDIQEMDVTHAEREMRTTSVRDDYTSQPNIAAIAAEQCLIKRETVLRILKESGRVDDFLRNPQLFGERFTEIVKHHRHELAIDGISYIKLDGEFYYAQEIFDVEELIGNLDKNAVPVEHSVYDHIVYDSSTVEKPFALALA